MFELFTTGGPIMLLMGLISFLALSLFVMKMLQLHRAQIQATDFLNGLYNVLRRGNAAEAVAICEDTPGPVAHLVRAAILKVEEPPEEIAKTIQQAGLMEIPRMEHQLNLLATLGKIAPMLGLLGTVLSLMNIFQVLEASAPADNVDEFARGMWMALSTTAAGLTVAMPIYAGYNLLVSRIESLVLDMEFAGADILAFLVTNRNLYVED
ncbi:MAG: MotA/TolQ/ExbB proton channel family protein [Verrucomicrobia bacterium]|nr:MotA/TolQ/ExbB proton channel family protein [Verrucomicrobiota bacterium]MCH8513076.1 MotA/TolQ/ExbB proton channel family protein [Kiritimatiellia bacterium]